MDIAARAAIAISAGASQAYDLRKFLEMTSADSGIQRALAGNSAWFLPRALDRSRRTR